MTRPATLVTGASSGLGAEFGRACARRGDEVVLAARREDRLQALAMELGPKAHAVVCDLSQTGATDDLLRRIAGLGLYVDTLINNAGFGLAGPFRDQDADRQREMLRVNIEALTMLTRHVLPGMIERRSGAILNVASTGGFLPGPGIAVYFATKAYVLSFTEALHQELRSSGVKVSALCPGPTSTEFGAVAGVTSPWSGRLSADAAPVVAAGLKGLARNQALIVPGLVNKATAQSSRFLPRAIMRRLVASVKM